MKKITLIALAALTMSIVSCEKEKVNPQSGQEQNANLLKLKETFNYSQTVTIIDETGKYSVDYIIQSDNKEAFNSGMSSFKNMRMKLLYENPVMPTKESSDKNNVSSSPEKILGQQMEQVNKIDYANTLIIKVTNVKKGVAKGFTIEPNTNDRTDYYVSGQYSVIYLLPQFANWYEVYNISDPVSASDYYMYGNGDTWTLSSQVNLLPGDWHDFSATNTPYRELRLGRISIGYRFLCRVSIY